MNGSLETATAAPEGTAVRLSHEQSSERKQSPLQMTTWQLAR